METELKKLAAAMRDMSDMVGDHHWQAAKAIEQLAQRDAVVERLRMQLAACGVVALANTPESAAKARDMHPDYRSASCDDVAGAVDREMAYRTALELQQAASVGGEREAFEAWVRREWPTAPLHYVRDALPKDDPRYGEYVTEAIQRAWVGWQARAALSAAGGGVVQVCKLGAFGSAYDMPETCRAFTYAMQPGNPIAWKLGRALSDAHRAGGGDWIDYGLGLLKTLQEEGFGVFQIAKPHCTTCDNNGRIGGPSFYAADEGGDPCPDCAKPQANSQEAE